MRPRLLTRVLFWSLCALLVAGSAAGQLITGGATGPAGGAVGGTCATANALARFTAAQTLACSAIVDTTGALTGITTLNMSGHFTSTLATGTAPFVVASTTNVVNLNASSLNGATFAAPGPIGGGTPNTAAFTSVTTPSVIFATTNTIGIPSDTTLTFAAANVTGATALTLSRATITQTSGNSTGVLLAGDYHPTATSTMVARSIFVNPTINYAAGTPGAGSYCTICADVIETALPTGTSYIMRMRNGVAGTTDVFAVTRAGVLTTSGAITATGNIQSTGGSLIAAAVANIYFSSRTVFGAPSDGVIRITKNAGGAVAFADLGTPGVGSFTYCSDCDTPAAGIMATCTSAGGQAGAWAFRTKTATPAWGCIGI
jgi:hypothetical protein